MFVILGANGKVGRHSIEALRRSGAPVRAVIRNADHAAALQALGCDIALADIHDGEALRRAMREAQAVQIICPISPRSNDAGAQMKASIAAIRAALAETRPASVLAISDYGAHHTRDTGIALIFHQLEEALRGLGLPLTLVRSAEHMQNWTRLLPRAIETGVLPSLHHPVTKLFPTISAADLGGIAAQLLTAGAKDGLRIFHAEGPERYSTADVAATLGTLTGREIVARKLPRAQWLSALEQGGLSASYARLVAEMYDAHNAGRIEVEAAIGNVRHGETGLHRALKAMLGSGP
ncbi:NAD(P)H-binding protein [Labrys sp. KNU-23]|uniref:NmrA family NAD(P)-binding protein n=1 Tax=Labrys sp. KNU-23 TaxID=2789216 RepID=UPI0011EEE735|nr:NmrA family NAD(P)-binding protein [Labrys sp. KNU-23]QEN89647.1 NAD(P)H-binding protein [Labrys sp. KNU-23]